jgi:ferredoxin-NADP reductase
MKGKLSRKEEIAEGTLLTEFALNEEVNFKAGQFFKLTLIDPPYTDERGNGRFLGFINKPSRNKVVETVTRLGPSAFKRYLHEAPLGIEAEIGEIGGEMTLPEDTNTPWVIVAGGIGIVPYMSMFRVIKEKSLPYNITLIYSNTKQSWAIFMDELEGYAKENPNFSLIATMTQDSDWQGEKRRIDEGFLREKLADVDGKLLYVSGTPRFVPSMVKALKAIGVPQNRLKFEIFTGY